MLKVFAITIVLIATLIAGLGNYRQLDNTSQKYEGNILVNVENVIENNEINEDIVSKTTLTSDVVNNVNAEGKIETNTSSSKEKTKLNISKNESKNTNKTITLNSNLAENKEKNKEENNRDVRVKEKTETKVEDTKDKVEKNTMVQETKYEYVYNYKETQRLKNDIEKIARDNQDLFDENGNKLYKVREFDNKEQAMKKNNFFSPYNMLEVKGVVLNTYSCTFLVYAIDYKINGILQQTRYYIKVAEY